MSANVAPNGSAAEPTPKKRRTPRRKKTAPKNETPAAKTDVAAEYVAATLPQPSEEAIRLRAYFICEERTRLALPGDARSDWVEARRQLLAELDQS